MDEPGFDDPPLHEQSDKRKPLLRELRADAVLAALHENDVRSVVDVGCGEGALLERLIVDPRFTRILGIDISAESVAAAQERLRAHGRRGTQRARVRVIRASAAQPDGRLEGFDAAVLMEVIEHIDLELLPSVESSVFASAHPGTVVITTPNVEYNVLFPILTAEGLRHPDHRFEWTRAEFRQWAQGVCYRNGYRVEHRDIGELDPVHGAPTQLALFRRPPVTN